MISDEFTKEEERTFMQTIGRWRPNLSKKKQKKSVRETIVITNRRQGIPSVIEVFDNRYHIQIRGKR